MGMVFVALIVRRIAPCRESADRFLRRLVQYQRFGGVQDDQDFVRAAQARRRRSLAHGRDVHQRQGSIEVPLSSRRQGGPHGDFLLTARRDRQAAARFLGKAIGPCGTPAQITIDTSGANRAAIASDNPDHGADMEVRQANDLNHVVEPDPRAVKRITRPRLDFQSFGSATVTRAGIELMHMFRKGQMRCATKLAPAQQFYSRAA